MRSDSERVWFRRGDGERRLELESCAMSILFPKASLRIKDELTFWYWKYQEYEIIIKYPLDYPERPLEIITSPSVDALPYELPCYFAPVAMFLAQMRINREAMQRAPSPFGLAEDLVPTHWYSTDWGKQRLQIDLTEIRAIIPDFRLLRLRDASIAYQFVTGNKDKINVLIVCPPKYPQKSPNVYITFNQKELDIPLQSMKNWSPAASIQNLVEELLQISEQVASGEYNSQEKIGEKICILISFKICPYCGRRNSENANYCVHCGSNIAPPE